MGGEVNADSSRMNLLDKKDEVKFDSVEIF